MDAARFSVILSLLVPPVVGQIMNDFGWDEKQATLAFYRSRVYQALADEPLKVWHYSPLVLARMFAAERRTGAFDFPEEAG